MFTISSWVCGRGFGRSASLQILAIAKLLLWFAPRNPSRIASPTPSFEIMNTFLKRAWIQTTIGQDVLPIHVPSLLA
ncbi:MAG TPA: hypothetical protein PLM12_09385, partial [Comamonas denitrificans]|nr:hypothetical protein [Comamonas denitrificans]